MTNHRIGYTLWPAGFDLSDPGPMLDEAEALGVDSVEIPLFCTRLVADGRPVEPMLRRFERAFAGRPLARTVHAMLSINLLDQTAALPAHEAVAAACIEVATRLGAELVVVHSGLGPAEDDAALEVAYARQRAALARLGDRAAAAGLVLAVENVWSFDGRATALPSRLAAEIAAIGHPAVGATVDFAHAALACAGAGAELGPEIAALAPHARHLHLNDCFGRLGRAGAGLPSEALAYGVGDLHLPIGWGSLDWDALIALPSWPETPLILNLELDPAYRDALAEDVGTLRRFAALMAGASPATAARPALDGRGRRA